MTENTGERIQQFVGQLVDALRPAMMGESPRATVSEAEQTQFWDALAEAAREGQTAFFRELLAEESDRALDDITLLMVASFTGKTEVVRALLAAGADPHVRFGQFFVKCDALSLAASKEHLDIVRLLVEAGADPDALDPIFRPLTEAVQKGRVAIARTLLELGADAGCRGLLANNTLLLEAADKGYPEIVRLLLDAGVGVRADNNFCETALDLACLKGRVEIVRMLLAAGGEADRKGRDGAFPLQLAAASPARLRFLQQQGILDKGECLDDIDARAGQIVELLLAAGADPETVDSSRRTPLQIAAAQGTVEVVRALLAARSDVNRANEKEPTADTPLAAAIENDRVRVVALLLEAGADPNRPDGNGLPPLLLAKQKGYADIAALLEARGATIAGDATKVSVANLIGAAKNGDLAALKAALQAGADANADDRDFPGGGLMALMYAAQRGRADILRELIDAGAELDRWDVRKRPWHKTALMYAAEAGQLEAARCLIAAGANVNLTDRPGKPGRTALMYATAEKHAEIVRLLVAAGADVDMQDRKGDRALDLAGDSLEIVRILLDAGADPYTPGAGRSSDSPIANAALTDRGNIVREMLQVKPRDGESAASAKVEVMGHAAYNGDIELVKTLLAEGIDANASERDDTTPLMWAAMLGNADLVQLLLDGGADPNLADGEGRTPFATAIDRGNLQAAKLLLAAGAAIVDLPESEGRTLLAIAADTGDEEIVAFVIELGADARKDDTALGAAVDRNFPHIVRRLIEAGADLERDGPAALQHAIACGHRETVTVLQDAGVRAANPEPLQ